MKKTIILLTAAAISLSSMADITVKLPKDSKVKELNIEQGYISERATKGKKAMSKMSITPDANGKAVIKDMPEMPAEYVISFGNNANVMVWSAPGENILVDIETLSPLKYKVTGSRLMEDYSILNSDVNNIINAYSAELEHPEANTEKIKELQTRLHDVIIDFLKNHSESPAAAYAMLELSDNNEEFLKAYAELTPASRESILMPYVEVAKTYIERNLAYERKISQLQSGNVEAPAFTFKDRSGKDVSLADFRGKWVIIDFWGSWCRWCIKGFPSLKEAYAKYKPELEIVGIACNDTPEAWVAAIDKYKLDWVNLYNPEQGRSPLLEEYAVQGFPTKVIVDPAGKIRNITSGDDPAFYEVLESLIGKDINK